MLDEDRRHSRLQTKLRVLADKYAVDVPLPESSDTLTSVDLSEGYPPDVQQGKYGVTLWNVGAFLEQPIVAPEARLVVTLRLLTDGQTRLLRCTVTDLRGAPKAKVPVDLWQCPQEDMVFAEKDTNQQGQVNFQIREEDLPWTSIGVGTVDGVMSIEELSRPVAEPLTTN